MYIGLVKNIPIGTSIPRTGGAIEFSEYRSQFISHYILLEKLSDGWYKKAGGKNLFHSSWLFIVDEVTEDKRIIFINTKYGAIYRYVKKLDEYSFKDIEFNHIYDRRKESIGKIIRLVDEHGLVLVSLDNIYKTNIIFKMVTCNHCKKEIADFSVTRFNIRTKELDEEGVDKDYHYFVCSSCIDIGIMDKTIFKCARCGTLKDDKDTKLTELIINVRAETTDFMFLCETNRCNQRVKKCNSCNKVYYDDGNFLKKDGICYCAICANKKYIHCYGCSNLFDKKEVSSLIEVQNNEYMCSLCYFEKYRDRPIDNYSYKPMPIFNGNHNVDELYLGFEFEINTPENRNQSTLAGYLSNELLNIHKGRQFCYIKSDSSIGRGIEVVTHPCNYTFIKKNINVFDTIFSLSKFGCIAGSKCGLHIHMNKNVFSSLHLYKFLKMIYGYKDFSFLISQRESREWMEQFCSFRPAGYIKEMANTKYNSSQYEDRHCAVNLNNENTIEIRIFKGCIEKKEFLKNVEYCISLYNFTKENSLKQMTIESYCEYIMKNQHKYKNLYDFLKLKGKVL